MHRSAVLVVLLTVAAATPLRAEQPTGSRPRASAFILSVDGSVWVQPADDAEPRPAKLFLSLRKGDTVRAEEQAQATILFSGGHIVRIPGGSLLEIVNDPGAPPVAAGRIAQMSERSLAILEEGLWVLSDPAGRILVGGMRGTPDEPTTKAGPSALSPLSPRNETVTSLRPTFRWHGSLPGGARVVVSHRDGVVWTSETVHGSALTYPENAPPLDTVEKYAWWVEDPEREAALTRPVTFETPTFEAVQDIESFEAELDALSSSDHAEPVTDVLRCAYYERLGAWSRLLMAASRLVGQGEKYEIADRAAILARKRMELDEQQAGWLIEAQRADGR